MACPLLRPDRETFRPKSARPAHMPRPHRTLLPALVLMLGAAVAGQQRNITALSRRHDLFIAKCHADRRRDRAFGRRARSRSVGSARAVRVPSQAKVITCEGMFVLAGFQNSHVHFTPPGWTVRAERTCPTGLAAARSHAHGLGIHNRRGHRVRSDRHGAAETDGLSLARLGGPRILTAGLPLYPPNGLPYYLSDLPAELLKSPSSASHTGRGVKDRQRPDEPPRSREALRGIPWVSRQQVVPMPQAIATAAARTAHKAGKLVFAHPVQCRRTQCRPGRPCRCYWPTPSTTRRD